MRIINLLPKSRQKELRYEAALHSVIIAASISAIIILTGAAVQMGIYAYLKRESGNLATKIEQLKSQTDKEENTQLKARIRSINTQMKDFDELSEQTPQWHAILREFSARVPEGIRVGSFTADLAKQQVDITGYSPTRELVIQLYNNINESKDHFYNIDYPLENVAKPTDIAFHFTFSIKEELLK